MPKPEKRRNVRPVEHGLARFNPNNELARPTTPNQLAKVVPHAVGNDDEPVPMLAPQNGGMGDTHQHIHIHMAPPRQQPSYQYSSWSYRSTTTTYYNGAGRLPQASAPALPATESPIASAIVRSVQLIVWLGAASIGVVVLGKFMGWW